MVERGGGACRERGFLTICIPSRDRPQEALRTVEALVPQIEGTEVVLVILDNCSSSSYSDVLEGEPRVAELLAVGRARVVRHACNIGMSANFMRAFEEVETEWLWILSDDDDVRPDAVSLIFDAVETYGEKVNFIKFSAKTSSPSGVFHKLDSLENFIDWNAQSSNAFNGCLLISNGLYRVESFLPHVGVGYGYANTYIPHFMMLVEYFAQGGKGVVVSSILVDYKVARVGYSYSLVAGLGVGAPKHAILNVSTDYYKKFTRLFFPHNDFKVIIDLFYHCQRDSTSYVCGVLSGQYIDYISVDRTIVKITLLRLMAFMVRFRGVFKLMISCASKLNKTVDRHVHEINLRYGGG